MGKTKQERIKEDLEQFDYCYEGHIDKERVFNKYSKLIGAFLIRFSELEHELDIAIADTFFDDDHSIGYRVIKTLSFSSKVDLFYEIYLEMATYTEKDKPKLKKIKKGLEEIRTFRNQLAHANWQTLTKTGFVRTKIESDKNDGNIQFIKVKILPETIEDMTEKVEDMVSEISDYKES